MRHRYFDLAFTPAVQAEQVRHGSREGYAAAVAGEAGPDCLTDRERRCLGQCDTFFLASVSHYPARIERLAVVTVEGLDWNCPQHVTPRFTASECAAVARDTDVHATL